MSQTKKYQIIIVGGGIVGLSLANLLAQSGFKIALIETQSPDLHYGAETLESRVSAINLAAEQLFREIDLWPKLKMSAAPLKRMKVWDGQSGAHIEFDSVDMMLNHLGWILENRLMIKLLWENLQTQENVGFYCPVHPQDLQVNETYACLKLANELELTAELIIGCDGPHSWVRKMMEVHSAEKSYEQKAIVAVLQSEVAHHFTAWQNFLSTGPLALLPLKNEHHSALVWSCDLSLAEKLMQDSEAEFNLAVSNASELCVGKLKLLTKRQAIPLKRAHVQYYVKPRLALVGDAAHIIHPLAGQGVNLGLMDAHYLAELLKEAKIQAKDLGSYKLLRRYERARKSDNEIMLKSMSVFKNVFASTSPWCIQARAFAIQFANQATWLKHAMAKRAIGNVRTLLSL